MTRHKEPTHQRLPEPTPAALVWVAGVVAALLLTLASSGTLSSWTSAVINNDNNTVATGKAVILTESLGAATCTSGSQASNVATCSTINKYGGVATPLNPGDTRNVDVTFSNTGAANGTSFVLAPGTCASTPTTGTPTPTNLCTATSELTIAVGCSPGATYAAGSAWSDLSYAAAVPPTATKTHTATGAELNAGASWTCRFTVLLNANASVASQNVTVTQPLTWTLNK